MLIREVILENFMSYEYARVPLGDGVNVVCGPNGSGKSSFLLGICVALGDTYTERSKKLSDLIRFGEDRARVSLLLDNSANEGRRPIPRFDSDVIRLTRNLRKDGKYWFEINQKVAQKYEVMNILNDLGFDPSNMLIVMHQNMSTHFAALPPHEKLKTLESAVGFESYRADVVEAKTKLGGILSEESSLVNLLDRARETLGYWRDQNERLQVKKQHQTRIVFLQREMAWSRVTALQKERGRLEQELDRADGELHEAEAEMERNGKLVLNANEELKRYQTSWMGLVEKRVEFERTIGICEYTISNSKDQLVQIGGLLESSSANRKRFEAGAESLRNSLKAGPTTLDDYFNILAEIEETQGEAYDSWNSELEGQRGDISSSIDSLGLRLGEAEAGARDVIQEMERVRVGIDEANDRYIDARIQMALLRDRRGRLGRRIDSLKAEIDRLIRDLNDAEAEAIIKGARVETGRSSEEILGEIRKVSGILMGMADVSENAEEMYESYSRTFNELQERVDQVRESRRQVMEEIDQRTRRWRDVMRGLLTEVNARYLSLLSMLQATGEVRLTEATDIEEAGLEIWVGFKGAVPSRLDPYTHSGGERSTSVMAFLLSLQQNVLSPFRAVDEFDLHMDPKNKEVVSEFIVKTMEGSDDQYMAITPSQITFQGRDIYIIMIHKTEGQSTVQVVE
ncbi:AAA family ATPase [Candidatus Bathyarchaeota archaeon]|nr:AAA family ATPase [Candidatus Bathyarchaeota archaeon]MBL7079963.1 AAA family ATPase [Candidatus Bathyarchaeota archaeon]